MRQELKVYGKYIEMHILSGMEYRGWWLMILQTFLVVIGDAISTILIFQRFGNVGVWTMERILLIYALALTSFGLAESFCRGFDYFPWRMIRSGDFDRLLLRPRSLFTQVAGSFFHLHRLPRVALGLAALLWALGTQGVIATAPNAIMIALALFGGTLTYCGVFVLCSGLAFYTVKGLDWIYIFTNASYQLTRCPIDYLPPVLRHVFTFFMPMLVISYYPASAVCGWGEPYWLGFLALPAGLAFLGFALIIWRIGVRHYQSTGS